MGGYEHGKQSSTEETRKTFLANSKNEGNNVLMLPAHQNVAADSEAFVSNFICE